MSPSGATAAVSWVCAIALRFVACIYAVLGAAQAELASNPQASVLAIFSTYVRWLDFAESGVTWEGQAAVLEECRELFCWYSKNEWAAPFREHFVSIRRYPLAILTTYFLLLATNAFIIA